MSDSEKWISYPSPQGTINAYTVEPKSDPPWSALIVIHGAAGVDDYLKKLVQDFAADGYYIVVPDIYSNDALYRSLKFDDVESSLSLHGKSDVPAYLAEKFPAERHAGISRAWEWMQKRPAKTYIDVVAACFDYLKKRTDVGAVGILGYCMGGRLVGELAARGADLAAGVIYYGIDPGADAIPKIKCPLLGHYASRDHHITDRAPDFAAKMKAAGKEFSYFVYEGDHGFSSRPTYYAHNPEAIRTSTPRTLEFLAKHLKKRAA